MPAIPGMNNEASPIAQRRGFVCTEARNIEFHPPGAASRRRGFQNYTASSAGGAIYNLFLYDRDDGGDRTLTLVGRKVDGTDASLVYKEIYNGSSETVSGAWATMSTPGVGWTTTEDTGRFFARDEYLYFADGTTVRGYEQPTSEFTIGLDQPTGKLAYGLNQDATKSRIEPGWYGWTLCAYHLGRNVRSRPADFTIPSTTFYGDATAITTYNAMGFVPWGHSMRLSWPSGAVTLDADRTHTELYRVHPFHSTGPLTTRSPARRWDDVRLVNRLVKASTYHEDRSNDGELQSRLRYAGTATPAWETACQHGEHWWFVQSSEPYRLYRSERDAPENVAQAFEANGHTTYPYLMTESGQYGHTGEGYTTIPHEAGPVKQPLSLGGNLLVLCANQTWVIIGSDWANYRRVCVDEGIGCVAAASAITTPYGAMWMSQEGLVWMPPTGRPHVVSEGFLDFDDSDSPVRLSRTNLHKCCAAYDPDRHVAEFAVPSYGSTGNDLVIALHLDQSTWQKPVWSYHVPNLGTGRHITAMTTVRLPHKPGFIVYATDSGGYTFYRTGAQDNDTSADQDVTWRVRGWLGADESRTLKGQVAVRMMPKCDYEATVAGSLWQRQTIEPPDTSSSTPTDTFSLSLSASKANPCYVNAGADPFLYVSMSETSSTPFEIHEFGFFGQEHKAPPLGGKQLG